MLIQGLSSDDSERYRGIVRNPLLTTTFRATAGN
jgi:hypothetical protein